MLRWNVHGVPCCALVVAAVFCSSATVTTVEETRPPNIVVVFADDLGYADVGCLDAKDYPKPSIDRLATEGIRFTNFYVARAVCSASRAALLTGCYSNRVGILEALGPDSTIGIAVGEATMAEVLKSRRYATAIFGKWHLGCDPRFLPTRHGFDEYLGLPYSNDMWPKHPTKRSFPDLPLIDGETIVALDPDQMTLTTSYADRIVRFIERNKDRPFFRYYLAHSMPHVPLHVSGKFAGKTAGGLFGDVIEEIDWSVGQVLTALKDQGIDRNTLVIFTSDNGPWLSYGDHVGSTGPFREGKGTSFEGGVREPFAARRPAKIPAGSVCDEPAMTIDLLPTFAHPCRGQAPSRSGHRRSGHDCLADRPTRREDLSRGPLLLLRQGAPGRAFRPLEAALPHQYRTLAGAPGSGGKPGPYRNVTIGLRLFDLESDPGEHHDVASNHPDVVARLSRLADAARDDLGDSLTNRLGKNVRKPGTL